MDASDIGRYGTISFMKRLDPDHVVATFPIDDEQITFGRDPACSVRLYYNSVSLLHCKIIFQERKAFLVVLGANGVVIDGCRVFPSTSASASATIPLTNNSEIEIHSKRFRFTYPPKELRAALLATPARGGTTSTPHRKRTLRMSMIQSAQVFSPRPSTNPIENLRVLQSPIKPFKTPNKNTRARPQDDFNEEGDDEQEIVLVDGNHPRVVEEEKDLVILEDVEVEDISQAEQHATPSRKMYTPAYSQTPQSRVFHNTSPPMTFRTPQQQPLAQTPRRRISGAALHRAVLIRSAQRAVMKAEIEKEEVEEEKEVEEFIVTSGTSVDQDSASSSQSSDDESEGHEEMQEGEQQEEDQVMSTWRKSFEAVNISSTGEAGRVHERDITDVDLSVDPAEEMTQDFTSISDSSKLADNTSGGPPDWQAQEPPNMYTPVPPRRFIDFTTPQPHRAAPRTQGVGRYSYGGTTFDNGGARRIVVEQAWRVKDIVLPEKPACIKEEQEHADAGGWDGRGRAAQRQRLSDDERKAIQERRRSALRTPDAFFGGQAPGMRRLSVLPAFENSLSPTKAVPPSPVKQGAVKLEQDDSNIEERRRGRRDDEDDALDTRSLLEKMKERVEGMKRRRSMNPRASLGLGMSPSKRDGSGEPMGFSLLAPGVKEELQLELQLERISCSDGVDEKVVNEEAAAALQDDSEMGDEEGVSMPSFPLRTSADGSTITPDKKGRRDDGLQLPRNQGPTISTKTPRMDDLRHVFAMPNVAKTPSFKGIRSLFVPTDTRVADSPAYEGVGEMMGTPEGYRASSKDSGQIEGNGGRNEDEDGKFVKEKHIYNEVTPDTVPTTTRRRGGRLRAGKQAGSDAEEGSANSSKRGRVLRGNKKTEEVIEEQQHETFNMSIPSGQDEMESVETSEGKKSGTPKPLSKAGVDIEQTEEDGETAPSSSPKPIVRRGRKKAAAVVSEPGTTGTNGNSVPPDAPTKPFRRSRTPKSHTRTTPVPENEPPPLPATTEITRTVRMRSKAQDDKGTKATNSTSGRKAGRAKAIDVDPDDDPLDSIGDAKAETQAEAIVPATKGRRGARNKTATDDEVKEEVDAPTGALADARVTGSKKAARAGGGSGTRTSARVKGQGSSPVTPTSEDGVDKENTPGAAGEEELATVEKSTKVKVSRSRKAVVKDEKVVEEDEVAPVTTKTRTTRARARK